MEQVKILLADDHTMLRKSLRVLLERVSSFEIIGESENGVEAVRMSDELNPDVIVMDIGMPELNGIEATKRILTKHPEIRIIILTMYSNEEYVAQIFKSDASGYIVKDSAPEELIEAIKAVSAGKKYISPKLSTIVVDGYIKKGDHPGTDPLDELTNREVEILQLIGEGYTNVEIAEKLFISVKTVETHRTNLSNKLNLHNKSELIHYAIKRGIATIK